MKCPGQDIRYWKPGAIFDVKCPKCGSDVEFFKDDTTRKCRKCGHRFKNPKIDFGCAEYCMYAEQCMGEFPEEFRDRMEALLKERIAVKMKKYFKNDLKRIEHAMRVACYAERIVKSEGGDLAVALAAAYLYDIDSNGSENSRAIMIELGAKRELIEEVCDIIVHHHLPQSEPGVNFKVVYDADLIVNLEEKFKGKPVDNEKLAEFIENSFLTESGRKEARKIFYS
jgi:hypothetical protein